ncbi:MAG: C69 family dipeptidase [Anaerolineales bacterium]|nr:C69 family dipeptidase [Anaerolineales bacterium]
MCDTIVVPANYTKGGVTLFAKNSDREPNEAQELATFPAQDYPQGASVRCTYIEIPQVSHTYAVLLSKPFWMFGAEMGANEHGLTIGNEAVFTREPYDKEAGLIGMDLLRLALERARTAREGVDVITSLLDQYGQGGNCGFAHDFRYHNSFILADPKEAWVLETAGKYWAAKQVHEVYAISNGLTLSTDIDLHSPGLIFNAMEKGWCKSEDEFNFAGCYSDFLYTGLSACKSRSGRNKQLLSQKGEVTVFDVITALRDHDGESQPSQGLLKQSLCMHAGFGPVRNSQTVGSLVAVLDPERPTFFATATAAPCTSIFKPVWVDIKLKDILPPLTAHYVENTLFWKHEVLHRRVIENYQHSLALYAVERDKLEVEFVQAALELAHKPQTDRQSLVEKIFERTEIKEQEWADLVTNASLPVRTNMLYSQAWKGFNRQAEMPE